MTVLEYALSYASKGAPVFPVKALSKVPAVKNGVLEATTDPTQIREWFTDTNFNIGMATGEPSGRWVLDVDAHEGLESLQAEHGQLPATLSQTTGGGGLHLVFAMPGNRDVRNAAKFWPGLDVRGTGGYIVVAPSISEKGPYRWDNKRDVAQAPDWLYRLLDKPKDRTPMPSDGYDGLGTPWGRKVLDEEVAYVAAQLEGGRHDALKVAALKVYGAVKGLQLSSLMADSALKAAGQRCGLPDREIDQLIGWAKDTAEPREPEPRDRPASLPRHTSPPPPQPPPVDSADEPAPAPVLGEPPGRRWPIYTTSELAQIRPPEWVIDGHVPDGFTVMYGASGSFKSFLALDWAMSCATGYRWLGTTVRSSPVVYVMAEGAAGANQRVDAWKTDRTRLPDGLHTIPAAPNLLSPTDTSYLADDVLERGAGLLIIDTMARCMVGGDENSAQDVGRFIAALDSIRDATGCAVLVVHHSGHEPTRPRGSTALFAAADAVVQVTVTDASEVKVRCDKQKDAAAFRPWLMVPRTVGQSIVLSSTGYTGPTDDPLTTVRELLGRQTEITITGMHNAGLTDAHIAQLLDQHVIERVPQTTATFRANDPTGGAL